MNLINQLYVHNTNLYYLLYSALFYLNKFFFSRHALYQHHISCTYLQDFERNPKATLSSWSKEDYDESMNCSGKISKSLFGMHFGVFFLYYAPHMLVACVCGAAFSTSRGLLRHYGPKEKVCSFSKDGKSTLTIIHSDIESLEVADLCNNEIVFFGQPNNKSIKPINASIPSPFPKGILCKRKRTRKN